MPTVTVSAAVDNMCAAYARDDSGAFEYWAAFRSLGDARYGGFRTLVRANTLLTPAPTLATGGPLGSVSRDCAQVPSHIHIVCWSDWNERQGLYAQVQCDANVFASGDPAWQIETGKGHSPHSSTGIAP